MSLPLPSLSRVLSLHGIETRAQNGRLFACEVFTTAERKTRAVWLDVTDWTRAQVYAWLGY